MRSSAKALGASLVRSLVESSETTILILLQRSLEDLLRSTKVNRMGACSKCPRVIHADAVVPGDNPFLTKKQALFVIFFTASTLGDGFVA